MTALSNSLKTTTRLTRSLDTTNDGRQVKIHTKHIQQKKKKEKVKKKENHTELSFNK